MGNSGESFPGGGKHGRQGGVAGSSVRGHRGQGEARWGREGKTWGAAAMRSWDSVWRPKEPEVKGEGCREGQHHATE